MQYGKFSSPEELLRGYNSLEQAYTQKCQQFAAVNAQLNSVTAAATPLEQSTNVAAENTGTSDLASQPQSVATNADNDCTNATPPPDTATQQCNAVSVLATPVANGNADSQATTDLTRAQQILADDPTLVDKLLRIVSQSSPTPPSVMFGGGNVSMALPTRPRTIREASELAKKYFD